MEPLIALVLVSTFVYILGLGGVRRFAPWPVALRAGIAVMFTMTGMAHFVGLRHEIIAMVPPWLPAPALLVTVTGVLELCGVVGVLYRPTAGWAAAGLSAMLVAMYPANVHAALHGSSLAFHDLLIPRTLMQIVFLAATVPVATHYLRARRQAPASIERSAPPSARTA
jgi:uncharacterized membrane protein